MFYPGASGPLHRSYEVEKTYFPKKFMTSPGVTYDYALLKLKEKVPAHNFIELSGDLSKVTNDAKLSIFGYPGKKYKTISMEGDQAVSQWGLSKTGRVLQIK